MIFFILFLGFVSVALFFLVRPLFWQKAIEPESFDERDYRKQLFKDQLHELEENTVENEISAELKDELGSVFLLEQEQQIEVTVKNKGGDQVVRGVFVAVAFLIIVFGVGSYWIVGGNELLEIEGAEELLSLDPNREASAIEGWTKRLTQRVEQSQADGKSWYLLGHAHLKVGAYAKASQAFSRSNSLIKDDLNILSYWLQARYLESGEVDHLSRGIIDDILQLDPGHVAVREVLGLDALKNGEMLTAISELSRAISATTSATRQSVLAALVAEARSALPTKIGGVHVTVKDKGEIPDESTVFVIARPVGGGMPYAVTKRPALMLPFSVVLDDLVSMQSTRLLSQADSFEVVVRASESGTINRGSNELFWGSKPLSKKDYMSRVGVLVEIGGGGKQTQSVKD